MTPLERSYLNHLTVSTRQNEISSGPDKTIAKQPTHWRDYDYPTAKLASLVRGSLPNRSVQWIHAVDEVGNQTDDPKRQGTITRLQPNLTTAFSILAPSIIWGNPLQGPHREHRTPRTRWELIPPHTLHVLMAQDRGSRFSPYGSGYDCFFWDL